MRFSVSVSVCHRNRIPRPDTGFFSGIRYLFFTLPIFFTGTEVENQIFSPVSEILRGPLCDGAGAADRPQEML
jgi:hypothetical protein